MCFTDYITYNIIQWQRNKGPKKVYALPPFNYRGKNESPKTFWLVQI